MKEQIMEILLDLRPDVDFETETKLIDSHVLESFDIVSLVADLEEEFEVRIRPKDLVAENFNSADAIEKLIKKLQEDSLNA
jgi:acyl carrier protein